MELDSGELARFRVFSISPATTCGTMVSCCVSHHRRASSLWSIGFDMAQTSQDCPRRPNRNDLKVNTFLTRRRRCNRLRFFASLLALTGCAMLFGQSPEFVAPLGCRAGTRGRTGYSCSFGFRVRRHKCKDHYAESERREQDGGDEHTHRDSPVRYTSSRSTATLIHSRLG
jgi:hypothetical protein